MPPPPPLSASSTCKHRISRHSLTLDILMTHGAGPTLDPCLATVYDHGPALEQCWVHAWPQVASVAASWPVAMATLIQRMQSSVERRDADPMLGQCCAAVADGGPTLAQHQVGVCLCGQRVGTAQGINWRLSKQYLPTTTARADPCRDKVIPSRLSSPVTMATCRGRGETCLQWVAPPAGPHHNYSHIQTTAMKIKLPVQTTPNAKFPPAPGQIGMKRYLLAFVAGKYWWPARRCRSFVPV